MGINTESINDILGPGGLTSVAVFDSSGRLLDANGNIQVYPDSAVAITGGTIDGTPIGATTPSTVVATTTKTNGYTVATLPAGVVGLRAYVTDATTPAYNAALVGGGAVVVPVFYNGTAWVSA